MGIFFQPMVSPEESDITILGLPWDGTSSGRSGARFGPQAIRAATLCIEDYSPYQHLDISDVGLYDAGDIELPFGDTASCLKCIREKYSELMNNSGKIVVLGGEHLISWPLVELMHGRYDDSLFVIQIDAHADLRETYLGVRYSHATVMHLISETVGIQNTAVIGVRSGSKEEWKRLRSHPNFFHGCSGRTLDDFMSFTRNELKDKYVYVTLDFDVFDPGIFPGTGTPEPGGMTFQEFIRILHSLSDTNIIGADIVELSPDYDHSGSSQFLAGTVLREILLVMGDSAWKIHSKRSTS